MNCPKCKGELRQVSQDVVQCTNCGAKFKATVASPTPLQAAPQHTAPRQNNSINVPSGPNEFGINRQYAQSKEESITQSEKISFCPNCGADTSNSKNFCRQCGKQLVDGIKKLCPVCGTSIDMNAIFCDNCGTDLRVVKQDKSAKDAWIKIKGELKKVNKSTPAKIGVVALLAVIAIIIVVVLTTGIGGTYFLYKNGEKQSQYYKFTNTKWTDETGYSGELKKKDGKYQLYDTVFGMTDVFLEGTIENGVFTATDLINDKTVYYVRVDKYECEHVFNHIASCVDRKCTICGFKSVASSSHNYDSHCVCTGCGKVAHSYADSYNCHDRICKLCGEGLITATNAHTLGSNCECTVCSDTIHTYDDNKTCHERTCTACYFVCLPTTAHTTNSNCVCTKCGESAHTAGSDCECIKCGATAHVPNGDCVCTVCGEPAHSLGSNCICDACGIAIHIFDSNGVCTKCGVVDYTVVYPYMTDNGYLRLDDTIYFGTYPQTKVTDTSLESALTTAAGSTSSWTSYDYYISGSTSNYMVYKDITHTDGNRYRGVYFTSYRPYYTSYSSSADNSYQDNNGYITGNVYWFRYDPIKWDILQESGGYATILANLILDSQDYYYQESYGTTRRTDYQGNTATVYDNNYQYSAIRTWLNETFYETAFTSLQRSLIQTVTVDNSASTTNSSSNQYACNNTNDKIWLLSYNEACGLYLKSQGEREHRGSDYAKSQGLYVSTSSSTLGKGYWWLRSPYSSNRYIAYSVDIDGSYGNNRVNRTRGGVLPALKIALS